MSIRQKTLLYMDDMDDIDDNNIFWTCRICVKIQFHKRYWYILIKVRTSYLDSRFNLNQSRLRFNLMEEVW